MGTVTEVKLADHTIMTTIYYPIASYNQAFISSPLYRKNQMNKKVGKVTDGKGNVTTAYTVNGVPGTLDYSDVVMEISNSQGTVIQKKSVSLYPGSVQNIPIDLISEPAGIYFLKIYNNSFIRIVKIIRY